LIVPVLILNISIAAIYVAAIIVVIIIIDNIVIMLRIMVIINGRSRHIYHW